MDRGIRGFVGGHPQTMTPFWLPVQGPPQPNSELLPSLVIELYGIGYGRSHEAAFVVPNVNALRR